MTNPIKKNLPPLSMPDHTQVRRRNVAVATAPAKPATENHDQKKPASPVQVNAKEPVPVFNIEEEKKILLEIYAYLDGIERKWKAIMLSQKHD